MVNLQAKTRNIHTKYYFWLLFIIGATYALMSLWTPPQFDDLMFISVYHDYSGDSSDFSLSALADYFQVLRRYDNSRLANLLSPFSTLFTPWRYIFPWLTGAMVSVIISLSLKICGIVGYRARWGVLLWTLMIILLPWRNSIFVADYSLNYIYAAGVNLPIILIMGSGQRFLQRTPVFVGAIALALIAGAWHEGFSITVLASLCLLYITRRMRTGGWRWWVVAVMYFLATCFIVFCPGIMDRSGREIGHSFNHLNFKAFFDLAAVELLVGSVLLLALFRSGRHTLCKAWKNDYFILTFGIALSGAALSLIVEHTPRTAFWPSLCAILALIILCHIRLQCILRRRVGVWIAAIMMLGCLTQSALAIATQHRFYKEYQEIIALFNSSDSSTVYYDFMLPQSVSKATLYFPARTAWVTGFHYYCLSQALDRPGLAVVPTALRHIPELTDTLSNYSSSLCVMRGGGQLFTRHIPHLRYHVTGMTEIRFAGNPKTMSVPAHLINFTTEEGDSLAYVFPYNVDVNFIDSIEITSYDYETSE